MSSTKLPWFTKTKNLLSEIYQFSEYVLILVLYEKQPVLYFFHLFDYHCNLVFKIFFSLKHYLKSIFFLKCVTVYEGGGEGDGGVLERESCCTTHIAPGEEDACKTHRDPRGHGED